MNEVQSYAGIVSVVVGMMGLIITLATVWWRMDNFRDKLDELRRDQDDKRIALMLRSTDDIAKLGERVTRIERNGHPK